MDTTGSDRENVEVPEGLWTKCPKCGHAVYTKDLEDSHLVCSHCGHYLRMGAPMRIKMLMMKAALPHGMMPLNRKPSGFSRLSGEDPKGLPKYRPERGGDHRSGDDPGHKDSYWGYGRFLFYGQYGACSR